ncbi:MAG TPA: SET domain-containing protein [Porticoccaceae bacterium]|nr:SET domain-containing protein [Porticoccaceae bacterium]HIK80810.1 SET domain-containing protein [Porticoccaceae bacterium]
MALDPKIAFKTFESNSYRPLPRYLTIKDSGIDGLGLFASEDIAAGTYAGETHVKIDEHQDWLRTPLGGFINHSEQPNAKINLITDGVRALTIEKAVKKGEEITVFYALY